MRTALTNDSAWMDVWPRIMASAATVVNLMVGQPLQGASHSAVSNPTTVDTRPIEVAVAGRILNAANRDALPGARVVLDGQTRETDGQGIYAMSGVRSGSALNLEVSKPGFATNQIPVPRPPGAIRIRVPDIFLSPTGKLAVTSIKPKYDGLFIFGAAVMNEFTATVAWSGRKPGAVEFFVNDSALQTVPTAGDQATVTLSMAHGAFFNSFTTVSNRISAVAVDASGERSERFNQAVRFIQPPLFLLVGGILIPFDSILNSDVPAMQWEFNFPNSFAAAEDIRQIPLIGDAGASFNFDCLMKYEIQSGKWGVFAGEQWDNASIRSVASKVPKVPKFNLADVEFAARAGLKAEGVASQTRGIVLERAGFEAEFGGRSEIAEFYLTDWIPGGQLLRLLDALEELGIDPNSIQRITLFGKLAAQFNLMAKFDPALQFDSTTITIKPGLEAVYQPDLVVAEGDISLGGELGFVGELAPEFRWKQITGQLVLSVTIRVFGLEKFKETFVLLHGSLWEASPGLRSLTGARPLGTVKIAGDDWFMFRALPEDAVSSQRARLASEPERFVGNQTSSTLPAALSGRQRPRTFSGLEAFQSIGRPAAEPAPKPGQPRLQSAASAFADREIWQADLALVENVPPNSKPALASRARDLMLLYVTGHGSANGAHSTDINWMRFDGTNWTAPATIQSNSQAEFSPQVAFDGNGDALAVWERVVDPAVSLTNLAATAAQMEIAWARWSRATRTWTTPALLTTNQFLDHAPLLCGPMNDGSLLVTWTANESNLLMGTNGAPSTVRWSQWRRSNQSWTPAQILVSNLTYRLSQSLSGARDTASYVWTADLDGALDTPSDQQVLYRTWRTGIWFGPNQLTQDTAGNRNARVTVGPLGTRYIVWQSGPDLVLSPDFATNSYLVRADSQTAAFADFALSSGPGSGTALLWQQASPAGSDAHYRILDPQSGLWSRDATLFHDSSVERSFATAWDDWGSLVIAYNKVEITRTNQTVTIEGGGSLTITNIAQTGRTDLWVTKRRLVKDVTLAPGDFVAQAENYMPGAAVTLWANLRNSGDLAVINPSVAFYDGDPAAGGVLITNVTMDGWLEGAATNLATAIWVVPEPGTTHVLHAVVDSANDNAEFDESNNAQSLNIGGTDLAVSLIEFHLAPSGALRVAAQVRNVGAPTATNSLLALRGGSESAILGSIDVPALPPGHLAQVEIEAPPGTVAAGQTVFVLSADDTRLTVDVDRANNTTRFIVDQPLDDADGDGIPDPWEREHQLNAADSADAALDADGDCVSNLAEYRAGTDPQDPNSYLRIEMILSTGAGGTVRLAWKGAPNKRYTLLRSTQVQSGWMAIATHLQSTLPESVFNDTRPVEAQQYFYRLQVE